MNIHIINMSRHQTPLSSEFILLGLLEQQPMHGYDLYKTVKSIDGVAAIWHVNQSQMYAILDKLKKMDLLSTVEVPGEAHPMRKEFHITPAGKSYLLNWMTSPVEHGRDMRQEFLGRLYFAGLSGKETALELIQIQHKTCLEWLTAMQTTFSSETATPYEKMVQKFRILQTEGMIAWLDYCASLYK